MWSADRVWYQPDATTGARRRQLPVDPGGFLYATRGRAIRGRTFGVCPHGRVQLKCFWCDTDFESSSWRPTLDELLAHIDRVRPRFADLVVITGGEPFRLNIAPLV